MVCSEETTARWPRRADNDSASCGAALVGDAALIERLLESGGDPESANADGQTALMLAARAGSLPIARLLVERGADVNAKEKYGKENILPAEFAH